MTCAHFSECFRSASDHTLLARLLEDAHFTKSFRSVSDHILLVRLLEDAHLMSEIWYTLTLLSVSDHRLLEDADLVINRDVVVVVTKCFGSYITGTITFFLFCFTLN
jgi:hypothetical protein